MEYDTCIQLFKIVPKPDAIEIIRSTERYHYLDGPEVDFQSFEDNKPRIILNEDCYQIEERVSLDTLYYDPSCTIRYRFNISFYDTCLDTIIYKESMDQTFNIDALEPEVEVVSPPVIFVDQSCETALNMEVLAIDEALNDDHDLNWEIKVDLHADGKIDYVFTSFAPAYDMIWVQDSILSNHYGLPKDVYWTYIPSSQSSELLRTTSGNLPTLPELLPADSKHKIVFKVTDSCQNFSSEDHQVEVKDTVSPMGDFVFEDRVIMEDSITPWGHEFNFKLLTASDYIISSEDNCTFSEDLYSTFNGIPFVDDTLVRIGQIFKFVNKDVPHFFNEHGFVDWNGDGAEYPEPKLSTLAAFNRNEIQLWNPTLKTAHLMLSGDQTHLPMTYQTFVSVWDEYFNFVSSPLQLKILFGSGISTTSELVGSNKADLILSMVSHPNPFSTASKLVIHSVSSTAGRVSVLNCNGEMLFEEKIPLKNGINHYMIDGRLLGNHTGLLFINLQVEGRQYTQKVIKI
jgi:hypothetical protein